MTAKRHLCTIILILLGFLLGAISADARRPNRYAALMSNAQACVMTDFLNGAPYPQGNGPIIAIGSPGTGDTVAAGKIYINYSAYAGWWVGDPANGSVLEVQLFVDGELTSLWDATSGKVTPLTWNTTRTAKGTHALVLRLYTADFDKTTGCYLDSETEYPVVQ